jgi:DNA repair ATPase RecN
MAMKYTEAEKIEIMAAAHGHLRRYREDMQMRQRSDAGRIVTKTIDHAQVPVSEPEMSEQDAEFWPAAKIFDTVAEALEKAIGNICDRYDAALARRDQEIRRLHERIEIEVGLGRKLGRLKTEIDAARQQAPSFKSELDALREQVAKQQKLIDRLRGAESELRFAQQKDSKTISLTRIQMTTEIGAATRAAMQELLEEENGFGFVQ